MSDVQKRSLKVFWGATLVLSLFYLVLGYVRSQSGLVHAFDTGLYLQILDNLWEGRGFQSSVTGETLFLAHHFQPVLLCLAPLYAMFKAPFVLLLLGWTSLVAASRFLLYYLPKQGLCSSSSAIILALALLLYPPLASRAYYSFVPEILALPALISLACLLEIKPSFSRGQWILFTLSFIWILLCKETLWLTGAWVSFLLTFRLRAPRERFTMAFLTALVALGFLYLFFVWMPQHSSHSSYYGMSYYDNSSVDSSSGYWGKALGAFLNIFTAQSLETLCVVLLFTTAGLLFRGKSFSALGSLPGLFLVLAASNSQVHDLTNHYLLAALPFLAVSAAVNLDKIRRSKLAGYFKAALILIPAGITLFHGSGFLFQSLFAEARLDLSLAAHAKDLEQTLKEEDFVLIDGSLQPLFSGLAHTKVILGFQGNPTHVTAEDLRQARHVITTNDLSELKDCRSVKPGEGDLTIFDYEGFYRYCEWLKAESFEKTILVPNRLIYLKRQRM